LDIAAHYTSSRHEVVEAQVALPDSQGAGVGMVASGGLSPLLGALYLTPLDRRMDRLCKGKRLVHYVRYMDDIVLLARTRWELRRAIAALHEEIAALGLHLHRVKRLIGRTTQGFDFLGERVAAKGDGRSGSTWWSDVRSE
jgi:hypothetical protein